ncbi:LCP family protein [Actinosynnema sp. NPDC047251]|uniref:Cell envelope-related transcriptional attenuator n=1 Tax=Saccharothrix espanaensis (strain ATCC 51144 / DSM 44229 / JCM 9112 / NBRC 15066 / NRRL 15764) TaxID=1179773 RepID=K0K914_SACES|nr:LCP family protein [Saccharothrix espanaensis]CCH34866.1 Cell envelope-related transcriptional attenuator [Saccharothrix espanaensis DSM 44229]
MKAAVMTGRTLLALLSAAVLVVAGYSWATLKRVQESVNTTDVLSELSDIPNAPPADDGALDILLVGSDSRTDAQGRPLPDRVLRELRTEATDTLNTDTIIVVRVPRNGGKAHAVSIPRDTYVPIPDHGDEKINSAYGVTKFFTMERLAAEGGHDLEDRSKLGDQAGRRALVQVVQDLTGVRVDHYAEVNLYGFYLLTQVVGGVEVCLNNATSDPDSGANFRAGVQTVAGGDALAFVRQRKNIPGGDLGRITRQQVFLKSAVSQLLSAGTLADPGKLNGLLEAMSKSVVVDEKLDLATLAGQVQSLAGGNVEFTTIPVTGVGERNERGQSIVTVDREQVKAFVAQVLGEKTPAPAPTTTPPTTTSARKFAGGKPVTLDGPRRVLAQGPPCVD